MRQQQRGLRLREPRLGTGAADTPGPDRDRYVAGAVSVHGPVYLVVRHSDYVYAPTDTCNSTGSVRNNVVIRATVLEGYEYSCNSFNTNNQQSI